ncbi:MAG: argininosuccinate lyase, partial [Vicinamibacteria bacterium]|nr:argininosuccinate lyase [Vicinamibacteria bacterium]
MKLWGGNYGTSPDAVFWEFNRSFPFDQRLLAEEIAASQAYVRALARAAALPQQDAERLVAGL